MTVFLEYAGHGLDPGVTVTTSTAGEGDTAPAVVQGLAPITRASGVYPVRFEFDQGSPITQFSYLVWAHTATNTLAHRWYQNTPSPGGGQRIATAWSGADGNVGWTLDVNFAGVLVLGDAGGTVDTGTVTVTDDVEYRVEVTYNAGTVEVTCYLGDATTPIETLNGVVADRQINEFWWGNTFNFGTAGMFHLDSLAISDEAEQIGIYQPPGLVDDGLRVRVEIAFGGDPADPATWNWVDVSHHVKKEAGINITMGRPDAVSQAPPSRCTLVLDNESGDYTPDLATSLFYPDVDLNNPLRVSVILPELGTLSTRFIGFVSVWDPEWPEGDVSDSAAGDPGYARIRVEAQGSRRRLGQGSEPLDSPLRREIVSRVDQGVVAYWPCEDSAGSSTIASAVGGPPLEWAGELNLAAFDGFAASKPLPVFDTIPPTPVGGIPRVQGSVPAYTDTGEFIVRMLVSLDPDGFLSDRVITRFWTDGTAASWLLAYDPANDGGLQLVIRDEDGVGLFNETFNYIPALGLGLDGQSFSLSIEGTQDGADIDITILVVRLNPNGTTVAAQVDRTLTSNTVGVIGRIGIGSTTNMEDSSIGHLVVGSDVGLFTDTEDVLLGWFGEFCSDRIARLCTEQNILFAIVGTANTEPRMGPQPIASFLDIIDEAALLDGGILFDATGFVYRNQATFYNQTPTMILDASGPGSQIDKPFQPTRDDKDIRNDITLSRVGGSSVRVTDEESIEQHGRYKTSYQVNVDRDEELESLASWRLHVGTWPGMRYRTVTVNLLRVPELMPNWITTILGDRIQINNLPPQHPTDTVDLLIQGWSETIKPYQWRTVINTTPAGPYTVGVLDDPTLGRLDTDGSELTSMINSTTTSVSVTITAGPPWTTVDVPFDITVGGEVMAVTAVTGASSPQTFTVTRSVNGVSKPHDAGTPVNVHMPFRLAL